MLRSRLGRLFALLTNERVFRQQFGALFSPQHPLDSQEAADQWSLICHNGGRTLGHRLIHYLDERQRYAERWHGAVRDWEGPLSFAWGLQDPVATTAVLDALIELRPSVPVDRLPELGHYPQLEDPGRDRRGTSHARSERQGSRRRPPRRLASHPARDSPRHKSVRKPST